MNTTTKFSPIHITLDKYNEFDTLFNVLENAIEQYEIESTERHFLIDLSNSLGEVYSFNEEENTGTDLDDNEEKYSAEGGPSDLYFAMRSIEERLSAVEKEVHSAKTNTSNNEHPISIQTKADWHKMTVLWALGEELEFFDFNDPGWYDLPFGQDEWYGYDEDVVYRKKEMDDGAV